MRLGQTVVGVVQTADDVTVQFTGGDTATGPILIAADGLKSRVRECLFGASKLRYDGYTIWRGVAPLVPAGYEDGSVSESWGRGSRFGVMPMGGGRTYFYATANRPENSPPASKADILAHFAGWHAPIPDLIAATPSEAIVQNDSLDREPKRGWSVGRVLLVGDAAHPTTPNLGQGGGMALEDAVVIANCLARAGSVAEAFTQFESLRYDRAAFITKRSRQVGNVGQWENRLAVTARDIASRLLPKGLMARTNRYQYQYDAAAV